MSKCRRAGFVLLFLVAAGISTLAQDRIPGDVNSDGAVADFLILASNYGKSGPPPVSDGVVDTVIVTRVDTLYEEDLRPEPMATWVDVYAKVKPSIYWVGMTHEPTVSIPEPKVRFVATAFAIFPMFVVTNHHVAKKIQEGMDSYSSQWS